MHRRTAWDIHQQVEKTLRFQRLAHLEKELLSVDLQHAIPPKLLINVGVIFLLAPHQVYTQKVFRSTEKNPVKLDRVRMNQGSTNNEKVGQALEGDQLPC